jgi:hypothetical protein
MAAATLSLRDLTQAVQLKEAKCLGQAIIVVPTLGRAGDRVQHLVSPKSPTSGARVPDKLGEGGRGFHVRQLPLP